MATHEEVAQAWFDGQNRAHNGSRMFHNDGCLYSHGRHFILARHAEASSGASFVLLANDNRSVSTSTHQSIARGVVWNTRTIHVPECLLRTDGFCHQSGVFVLNNRREKRILEYYNDRAKESLIEFEKKGVYKHSARQYHRIREYWAYISEYKRIAALFGKTAYPEYDPWPEKPYKIFDAYEEVYGQGVL